MVIMEAMENLASYIREQVKEYETETKAGKRPIAVYAGYPPVRDKPDAYDSFIYCCAKKFQDTDDRLGVVDIEIGFSIYDNHPSDGWKSLYNLMEHVRQALLRKRTLGKRNRLVLPLTGEIVEPQPYPQWQARMTVSYTIAQPEEEGTSW